MRLDWVMILQIEFVCIINFFLLSKLKLLLCSKNITNKLTKNQNMYDEIIFRIR